MNRALVLKALGVIATAIASAIGAVYTSKQDAETSARENAGAAYEATANAVRNVEARLSELDRRVWDISQKVTAAPAIGAGTAAGGGSGDRISLPPAPPPTKNAPLLPRDFGEVARQYKLKKAAAE